MADDAAEERRLILRLLEEGKITPEQAVELLKALSGPGPAQAAAAPGAGRGDTEAAAAGRTVAGAEGPGRAGPGVGGREPGPGERGADVVGWVEQLGIRIADLAEELADRVERAVSGRGGLGERAGEATERLSELGERLQEVGRTVADRLAQAFGQLGAVGLPTYSFTEELSGEFGRDGVPHLELVSRNGSITVSTAPAAVAAGESAAGVAPGEPAAGAAPGVPPGEPAAAAPGQPLPGRRWRLVVRKQVRARTREDAESLGARLISVTHGPSHLSARCEGWMAGSVDLELTLPAGLEVTLRAEAANGSIALRGVRADSLEARSTNGRLDLSHVEARRAVVRASNGSLLLDGLRGEIVEAGASNGSVTGAVCGAQVRVSASNGSITLRPEDRPDGPAHQRVAAEASNGSVRVILPARVREAAQRQELGLALEANSSAGSARIEVPGTVLVSQSGPVGRQRVAYQTPNLERAARTLRVEASARMGSVAITAD